MIYTSCIGCYQGKSYAPKNLDTYRSNTPTSTRACYSNNGIEMQSAPDSAYALTGKPYNPQ